jgi:light-regulated signal transduction histidine kinase (bacteriophytochrome)
VLLSKVWANTGKMNQLIDDLLKFPRMTRQPMIKRIIQTGDLARSALGSLSRERENWLVKIIIADLPPCQSDISLLTPWLNLIGNAIKYTRKRPVARIEIGCQKGMSGKTIFYEQDNGMGFDIAYVSKLFDVLQRLHSESEFEGTGVGLALCQHIITRPGGRFLAGAEVEQSAVFYFTLRQDN